MSQTQQREVKEIMSSPDIKTPWKATASQVLVALVSSLSYLSIGCSRAWASTSVPSLNNLELSPNVSNPHVLEQAPLDPEITSWIIATLPLGALTGSFFSTVPLNFLGRKISLIIGGCLFCLSFVLIAVADFNDSIPLIMVGRVIGGLAIGLSSPCTPIYISEVSMPAVRGTLASFPALLLAVGVLLGYTIGIVLSWWQLAWFMLTPSFLLVIGMIFLPETPSWLAQKRRPEAKILSSIKFLRGGDEDLVRKEMEKIKPTVQPLVNNNTEDQSDKSREQPEEIPFWTGFFSSPCLYPLFLSLVLMLIQMWCGVNVIIFKTVDIFAAVGSSIDKYVSTAIVGVVNLVATAVSVAIVDKTGRRLLLLISCGITAIAQAILGGCFYMGTERLNEEAGWLPLATIILAFIGYALGLAAVPFIIMGEMLPIRYRSVCGPISTTVNLTNMFILLKLFNNMKNTMAYHGVFWFYAAMSSAGFFFVLFLLPETKGKTLEQIEAIFNKRKRSIHQ